MYWVHVVVLILPPLVREVDMGDYPKSLTTYTSFIRSNKPNLKSIYLLGAKKLLQNLNEKQTDKVIPIYHPLFEFCNITSEKHVKARDHHLIT